jgi:hypothetical protein
MKVKIKTWAKLEEEFGLTRSGSVNCGGGTWLTLDSNHALPTDRIIDVGDVGGGRYEWSAGIIDWYFNDAMIEEFITDKPAPLKAQMDLIDLDFVAAMAINMERGIKGARARDDWKIMKWTPETQSQYRSKLLRHVKDREWAAVACNAMILFLRGE